MKKKMRIAALLTTGLLALTPCALASTTAFAEGEDSSTAATEPTSTTYSITVDASNAADSEFEAYQIFTGNSSGGKLNDIQWGSAIPSSSIATMLDELKADSIFVTGEGEAAKNLFADLNDDSVAADYAEIMGKITDKSGMANELAKVLGKYVTTAVTDSNSAADVIGGVASGYYLIKEKTAASQTNPISLNLLKVVGENVTIKTKEDLPSLTKVIDEEGGITANTASVGDKVPFILTSNVPDMTGYTKYFFVMNDTLSAGLTYNDDMKIYVGGTQIAADKYTVTTSGTTNIEIVFKDFYNNYKALNDNDTTNDAIVVKYSATVNANADMTQVGNTNIANLTYSNNPNVAQTPDEGNTDKPGPTTPKGVTPDQKTVTYVTQIDLLKTKADSTTPVAGAKFKLEGYMKTVAVSEGTYFMADDEGTYYRLKDGTFKRVDEFVAGTDEFYDSLETKYSQVAVADIPDTAKITKEVPTGTDGKINFAGLGEGVYTITETEAPDGFNKLLQPITVTITATPSLEGCVWDKTLSDPNNATTAGDFIQGTKEGTPLVQSSLPLTVINTEGSTLPSTGGIGTKLFYLFGGMLAIGSGVILVTKKRMANTEK